MGLYFEVVAVLEHVRVPLGHELGLIEAIGQQVRGHLSGHAGAGNDDARVVFREQLAVDARFTIEALGVGERGELDQIAIPLDVTREEYEVVVVTFAGGRAGATLPVTGGDVGLHPDDRLDASFVGLLLKLPCRVQIAVVGNGNSGLLELLRLCDQVVDTIRPVEERIFGMAVQVYEAHGRPLR